MLKMMMMRALLIVSAASLSGCIKPGDFCDVVQSPITFTPETSAVIVKTDRAEAVKIATQNEYGATRCDW